MTRKFLNIRFPGFVYKENSDHLGKILYKPNDNIEQCLVCLENFIEDEWICKLNCNHIFHEKCIKIWLNKDHRCPLCRYYN